MSRLFKTNFLPISQGDKEFKLCLIPAGLIVDISYAAIRGVDHTEGAIQRVLQSNRINKIKDFILQGGDFPASIVLNWVSVENALVTEGSSLSFEVVERSAQLIDGQHRIAGFEAAINEKPEVANFLLPVAIYENLPTNQCANIFLSINTEQKPVPRSLVFDLYGVADDNLIDSAASRARDIALSLNDEDDSPYAGQIKLPGSPVRKGGVALSTAVTTIKPLVEKNGEFQQRGIHELTVQTKILLNYFKALESKYGDSWSEKTNAFMYASGFSGAVDFFKHKLLSYCGQHKNFQTDFIASVITLDADNLILQEEVKGIGGKDAPVLISDRLNSAFNPDSNDTTDIQI